MLAHLTKTAVIALFRYRTSYLDESRVLSFDNNQSSWNATSSIFYKFKSFRVKILKFSTLFVYTPLHREASSNANTVCVFIARISCQQTAIASFTVLRTQKFLHAGHSHAMQCDVITALHENFSKRSFPFMNIFICYLQNTIFIRWWTFTVFAVHSRLQMLMLSRTHF